RGRSNESGPSSIGVPVLNSINSLLGHYPMDARQAKGFALAANAEITREGNVWIVPSESSSKTYIADLFLQTCTCPDFEKNKIKCKHLHAVDYLVRKESNLPLPAPEKRSEEHTSELQS